MAFIKYVDYKDIAPTTSSDFKVKREFDGDFWTKQQDVIVTKFFVKNGDMEFARILNKEEFDTYNIGDVVILNGTQYYVYGQGYEIYKHRITEEIIENQKMFTQSSMSKYKSKYKYMNYDNFLRESIVSEATEPMEFTF